MLAPSLLIPMDRGSPVLLSMFKEPSIPQAAQNATCKTTLPGAMHLSSPILLNWSTSMRSGHKETLGQRLDPNRDLSYPFTLIMGPSSAV